MLPAISVNRRYGAADILAMRLFPHNHPLRIAWNFLMLGASLLFFFSVGYRASFGLFRSDWTYWIVCALFAADIGFTLCTKVKMGHIRIDTRRAISRHYARTWLVVDVLAAIPFEAIIFGLCVLRGDGPSGAAFVALQALPIVNLLKAGRIFRELQEALGVMPSVHRLIQFGYWLAAILHVMVLGWILIGASESGRTPGDQYLRGLYWVVTTIATIGYGDYTPNHDQNIQILYTIVVEVFGVGMFSYVIANVSSLVTNLDVARGAHQRRFEEVNSWLRAQRVPPEIQEHVHDYYSYLWKEQRGVSSANVLDDIPRGLSQEILLFLNREVIERVDIFRGADELFIRETVQLLRPRFFLPDEYVIRQGEFADCMYFLASGDMRILKDGVEVARLGPGSPFGETALIENSHRNASVVSVSYSTGYRLEKEDFNVLRSKYPDFDRQVTEIARHRKRT